VFFFFQAEDGIRDWSVTGVQTCALPISAKPLVLYDSDDLVAMGSEEIAIRSVLPQEIDTYDPFDGEVKVWQI